MVMDCALLKVAVSYIFLTGGQFSCHPQNDFPNFLLLIIIVIIILVEQIVKKYFPRMVWISEKVYKKVI